ncbi:12695_t:CDS:2, partial [Dentiscutata erythropus]
MFLIDVEQTIKKNKENLFLKFKNEIIDELKDDFEINEYFDSNMIVNDRSKDIMISRDDIEALITCKYRPKAKIRFNDIERTAAISEFYGVQGIVVTNLGYGKEAIRVAKKHDIILTHKFDIKHKLNFYIEKEVERKELDILEDIERKEKIYL